MKNATFIRKLDGFNGDARLFKVEPPIPQIDWGIGEPVAHHEFVIVSAANVFLSGPETYIFPANESGEVVSWGELEGSFKGGLNHEQALRRAGYEISSVSEQAVQSS